MDMSKKLVFKTRDEREIHDVQAIRVMKEQSTGGHIFKKSV